MSDKYKFDTLEELQIVYPIHSVFSEQKAVYKNVCYNCSNDTNFIHRLKKEYDSIEINEKSEYIGIKKCINTVFVEGYLYDGKYWYPAQRNRGNWTPLNEYDTFKEEEAIYEGIANYL